jgi:hypothetical protein
MDNLTRKRMADAMNKVAKWIYIIFAAVVVIGIAYILYNQMNRPIAGVLFFIGGFLASYFYYVKWFVVPTVNPAWPPYQTICPDYLTPITPGYEIKKDASGKEIAVPQAGGKLKCVDFVGVSRNGRLRRASPAQLESQQNNPEFYFEVDPKQSKNDLRARLQSYGLSWVTMFNDE